MGNQKSKPKYLPCLNQSDENGQLLIENSKIINPSIRLFVTTKHLTKLYLQLHTKGEKDLKNLYFDLVNQNTLKGLPPLLK